MKTEKNMMSLLRENKTLLVVIGVVLCLIELEIFAIAAVKSGEKTWLQVLDNKGNVIHEVEGRGLRAFDKELFEKTFGPLNQYQLLRKTKDYAFPFRAWFAAAVGIPVGVILLFVFAVKAYLALFYEEKKRTEKTSFAHMEDETRFEKMIARISRFNIFTIGVLVFLSVVAYWILPNMILYAGKTGVEMITRYKWVFLSVATLFFGLVVWVIYLRYLLAKKTIESQVEVDKYRLQLELNTNNHPNPRLEYSGQETDRQQHLVDWNKTREVPTEKRLD